MNNVRANDARIQRTKASLRKAFFELILSKPYADISVHEIIFIANVGRSTFYQHYKSKDDLLLKSLEGPMEMLALAAKKKERNEDVERILQHFWENRSLTRHVLSGDSRKVAVNGLTIALINQAERYPFNISKNIFFEGMADMLITVIVLWLSGRTKCSFEKLAIDIINIFKHTLYLAR